MFLTHTRTAVRESPALTRLSRLPHEPLAAQPNPTADPVPPAEVEPRGDPWWRRARAGQLVERWLPGADPPRRRLSFGVLAVLVLALAVGTGIALAVGGEPETPPPGLPVAQAVPDPTRSAPGTAADPGSIVVSVVGRVARPGLVTLPEGARVADALQAAGGTAPGADVSTLNIARRLTDGEQIYVGVPAPPEAAGAPAPDTPAQVDLNSASVSQLDTLPGVGAVTAQRIIDWRTRHGRFIRVEQLRDVDGIGQARYDRLKDLVVVR